MQSNYKDFLPLNGINNLRKIDFNQFFLKKQFLEKVSKNNEYEGAIK